MHGLIVGQSISISGTTIHPPEANSLKRTFMYRTVCSYQLFKNPFCFPLVILSHFPSPPHVAAASSFISVFPRN